MNHILALYFKLLPQITVVSLRDWQRLKIGVLEFTLHIHILNGKGLRMSIIIESFADEMNDMPRKLLDYATPEELFDKFLNQIYSMI